MWSSWKTRIVAFGMIVFVSGCTGPKTISSYENYRTGINEVCIVDPISYINIKENKDETLFDRKGSLLGKSNVKAGLDLLFRGKMKTSRLEFNDRELLNSFNQSCVALFAKLNNTPGSSMDTVVVDKCILNTLKDTPVQYHVLSYITGYNRSAKNLKQEMTTSALVGIATLGMAMPMPERANSTVGIAVIDKVSGKVIYFNKNFNESSPTILGQTTMQLNRALKGFMHPVKSKRESAPTMLSKNME